MRRMTTINWRYGSCGSNTLYVTFSSTQAVFALFISQLRGLDNTADESFTLRYYLLENLESVKAFNLLIDLNDDVLFVQLFKTFFESITYVQFNVSTIIVT